MTARMAVGRPTTSTAAPPVGDETKSSLKNILEHQENTYGHTSVRRTCGHRSAATQVTAQEVPMETRKILFSFDADGRSCEYDNAIPDAIADIAPADNNDLEDRLEE
jgi:hypothetical protein